MLNSITRYDLNINQLPQYVPNVYRGTMWSYRLQYGIREQNYFTYSFIKSLWNKFSSYFENQICGYVAWEVILNISNYVSKILLPHIALRITVLAYFTG